MYGLAKDKQWNLVDNLDNPFGAQKDILMHYW